MLILKLVVVISALAHPAKFDGGGDLFDLSSWKCAAQGEEDNRKVGKVEGDPVSVKKNAKDNAYIKCRSMGLSDCEIISCQQIPHRF